MRIIAVDTETHLIAPGRLAPPLVCMTYCGRVGMPKIAVGDDMSKIFHAWIVDPDVYLVFHNGAFDLAVLAQHDAELLPLIFEAIDAERIGDTLLREQLRCIAHGNGRFCNGKPTHYSLSACVERHFGEVMQGKAGADVWRMRYHELDGVPLEEWPIEAVDYARKDAEYTLRVWQSQMRDEFGEQSLPDQVRAAWGLHLMSCWGVRTDPKSVADLARKLDVHLRGVMDGIPRAVAEDLGIPEKAWPAAEKGLRALGIYRKNGTKDTKHVRSLVDAAYGGNPPTTETGLVSTSRETLEGSGNVALLLLASVGALQKVQSTYLPHLIAAAKGAINPRYTAIKETGRTSSSAPNIQNVPRLGGVRDCFVPLPGRVFVGCDYHVAEMCSLAQVLVESFGQSAMADAINDGRELHLETAAGLLGWSYDRTRAAYRAGDAAAKQSRQLAKVANFGFPGGMSAATMVGYAAGYGVTVTLAEATDLREAWLARYPEMRLYFDAVGDMTDAGFGSYTYACPVTGFIRGGLGYTEGCNHPFQLRVAAATKAATWHVARESYTGDSPLRGSRPWGMIHDEIILSARRDKATGAAARLAEIMVRELQARCPDVRCTADAHVMPRWHKDAGPVHIDGKLAIWTPEGPVAL